MSKLDINTILNKSLSKKLETVQESDTSTTPKLAVSLEDAGKEPGKEDCPGCGKNAALALQLENVAYKERVEQFIGEDVVNNIKAALGAGLATFAVLEARHS
jgi:hypothetical protein